MTRAIATQPQKTAPKPAPSGPAQSWRLASEVSAVVTLAVTLLACVPLFLRMGVWGDTTLFDLAARTLLRRGHCYQDIFFHGPPGMIWAQLAVRTLVGWSSVGLRAADLVIFSAVVWLLARGVQPRDLPRAASVWIAATLFLLYFSGTEWAHCQTDGWMLLPALGALWLRQRQASALADAATLGRILLRRSLAEGVLWGLAFLIKPFVAFPAVLCLLVTAVPSARALRGRGATLRLVSDGAGVLAGGMLVGVASVTALYLTADWSAFLAAAFGGWNSDYTGQSLDWLTRSKDAILASQWPWSAVYLAAIPVAVWLVVAALRRRPGPAAGAGGEPRLALLAAFFLGWFFQANYLQKQFEYQTLPALLPAWALVLGWFNRLAPRAAATAVLPAVAVVALVSEPLLTADRLRLWRDCWVSADSDRLKDELARNQTVGLPPWRDLRGVIQYLQKQGAKDREVTCWHFSTIAVLTETGLEPSSRFVFPSSQLDFFPRFRKTILDETMNGPQRFVVLDQGAMTLNPQQNAILRRYFLPPRGTLVFHANRFVVLRVPPRAGLADNPG